MHHTVRTVLGALGATFILTATMSPVVAEPLGAPPAIAWYNYANDRIVLPDGRSVSTADANPPAHALPLTKLINARGGFLLELIVIAPDGQEQTGNRLTFLDRTGRARTVVKNSKFSVVASSTDGRTAVLHGSRRTPGLRAVRISDGTVLDGYKPKGEVEVMAASEHHVIVQRNVPQARGRRDLVEVVSWNPTKRSTKVVSRHLLNGRSFGYLIVPAAASATTRRYATYSGDHAVMLDADSHRTLWRTSTGEVPLVFSPDGRRVATVDGLERGEEDISWTNSARTVRVRNAANGRILATFTGKFLFDEANEGPIWETPQHLFVRKFVRGYPWALERCSVASGRCALVSGAQLVQPRSG